MEEEEEDGEEMEGKEGESMHQGRFPKHIEGVCLVIEFLPLGDEYYDDVPALDPKNENPSRCTKSKKQAAGDETKT